MQDIHLQRCFNHKRREAVARCPECGRFFCRECITEHEDRVLCTACLNNLSAPAAAAGNRLQFFYKLSFFILGFMLLWATLYGLGQALLWLPDTFHEGTLWK